MSAGQESLAQPIEHVSESSLRLDVAAVRADFPILTLTHKGHPLVYLDNAATSQKPLSVIEAIDTFYRAQNANVHRGVHYLSQVADQVYEGSRKKVKSFINAALVCEIIFTRGATESINLVAQTYGRANVGRGDEIIVSHMEHHSNIVPWQLLCEATGATLKVIPIDDSGALDYEAFEALLSERTRIVSVVHVSNALGTVNEVKRITDLAHRAGAVVLLDGAQSVPHMSVDVQALGCDFFAFSGHKMCGPTGIGVLYGKAAVLEKMPPWQGGGDMIKRVTFEKSTYNSLPYRFEAGTPNIAGVAGLGAAVDYLNAIGMDAIAAYEQELLAYGTALLSEIPGLTLIGTAPVKASVLSFVLEYAHPHDIGQILDDHGVAIRTGHHCAQPVMDRFGVPATARASLAFYNTREDLDALVRGIAAVRKVFV